MFKIQKALENSVLISTKVSYITCVFGGTAKLISESYRLISMYLLKQYDDDVENNKETVFFPHQSNSISLTEN